MTREVGIVAAHLRPDRGATTVGTPRGDTRGDGASIAPHGLSRPVAHEITDLKKLELIRKLRDTTGRSPEEAKAFLRAADRLEAKRLSIAN